LARSRAYFDYNAGAPLRPEARAAMLEALALTGNASSVHAEGRAARARVEKARAAVAGLVAAQPKNVTFTSGGTEANVTALSPALLVEGKPVELAGLLVGATEHLSVLSGGRFPADKVMPIPVNGEGVVDLGTLEDFLDSFSGQPVLVSVMLANNETGAIQPVAEVARLAHAAGAYVHSDAIQALGRVPVDLGALGVDFLSVSAHKIGGPQGVGAVVRAREGVTVPPLLTGGGQERNARAGTESVAAIAGFGAAAAVAAGEFANAERWLGWRKRIESVVAGGHPRAHILSGGAERLPQTVCVALEGVAAETLLIALDLNGVAVSAGSACTSGRVSPSHVLAAMGKQKLQRSAVRISFGWATTEADLDHFEEAWTKAVAGLAATGIVAAA
jgi:cysteine desulfurase